MPRNVTQVHGGSMGCVVAQFKTNPNASYLSLKTESHTTWGDGGWEKESGVLLRRQGLRCVQQRLGS